MSSGRVQRAVAYRRAADDLAECRLSMERVGFWDSDEAIAVNTYASAVRALNKRFTKRDLASVANEAMERAEARQAAYTIFDERAAVIESSIHTANDKVGELDQRLRDKAKSNARGIVEHFVLYGTGHPSQPSFSANFVLSDPFQRQTHLDFLNTLAYFGEVDLSPVVEGTTQVLVVRGVSLYRRGIESTKNTRAKDNRLVLSGDSSGQIEAALYFADRSSSFSL